MKQKNALSKSLLILALVAVGCSSGGDAASVRLQSQAILSSPPDVTAVNETNGLSYCHQTENSVIRFFSAEHEIDPTLTVPGVSVLNSIVVTRVGVQYLVVAALDAQERCQIYRYHDTDMDGIPDVQSELELLDIGATPTYVTSISMLDDGTTYLLDARCQDILIASDTDSDGWPDIVATTPFAMSATFPDLVHVGAIRAAALGDVRGALAFASQSTLTQRGDAGLVAKFEDTDGNSVADIGTIAVPSFATLQVLGIPATGHQTVFAKATIGETIEVWSLDSAQEPFGLLGSATATNHDWATISLSRALLLDESILVRLGSAHGTATRSKVWAARAQIGNVDPTVVDIGGGTITIEGLDFVATMEVVLRTADDVELTLAFSVIDDNEATVTVPALGASAEGPGHLIVRDPAVPGSSTALELHVNELTE